MYTLTSGVQSFLLDKLQLCHEAESCPVPRSCDNLPEFIFCMSHIGALNLYAQEDSNSEQDTVVEEDSDDVEDEEDDDDDVLEDSDERWEKVDDKDEVEYDGDTTVTELENDTLECEEGSGDEDDQEDFQPDSESEEEEDYKRSRLRRRASTRSPVRTKTSPGGGGAVVYRGKNLSANMKRLSSECMTEEKGTGNNNKLAANKPHLQIKTHLPQLVDL